MDKDEHNTQGNKGLIYAYTLGLYVKKKKKKPI